MKWICLGSVLVGELTVMMATAEKEMSAWDRLSRSDKWGVIMAVAGLVFGLMNYVTWWRGETDLLMGESRSRVTLLIIQIFFQIYLIAAACWGLEVFR